MDGRCRRAVGRHNAGNRRSELTFGHVERARHDRSERKLQRNHHAAAFERAHDPTESTERHRTMRVDVRMPGAVEHPQHFLEHGGDIGVAPRLRLTSNGGNHLRGGVIVATQPDLDGKLQSG